MALTNEPNFSYLRLVSTDWKEKVNKNCSKNQIKVLKIYLQCRDVRGLDQSFGHYRADIGINIVKFLKKKFSVISIIIL